MSGTPRSRSALRLAIAAVVAVPSMLLLVPALALTAVIVLFPALVRWIGRRIEPVCVPWSELLVFDPLLGWKPRPQLDAHYLALHDDVFRAVTDDEGWPGRQPLDESDVVVVGDSFAFGYGVDASRTFAAKARRLRVKAVGAPGYSMVQGVRLLEQFGGRLEGRLVVWFAFLENDLQDNLTPDMRGYRAPFVRFDAVHGPQIVDRHLSPTRWTCSELDTRRLFSRFCVPGVVADRAYAASEYLIARAQRACRQAGARLVLVTIPHPSQLTPDGRQQMAAASGDPERFDVELPDRRIAEACRREQVPLIVGTSYLSHRDYKAREGIHWNEQGHRKMARLLEQLHSDFTAGRLDDHIPTASVDTSVPSPSHATSSAPALARSAATESGA